ncbi:hypothetical protein MJH12_18700, partial [bacterium]|nr:hypothetical protein [bacterium]
FYFNSWNKSLGLVKFDPDQVISYDINKQFDFSNLREYRLSRTTVSFTSSFANNSAYLYTSTASQFIKRVISLGNEITPSISIGKHTVFEGHLLPDDAVILGQKLIASNYDASDADGDYIRKKLEWEFSPNQLEWKVFNKGSQTIQVDKKLEGQYIRIKITLTDLFGDVISYSPEQYFAVRPTLSFQDYTSYVKAGDNLQIQINSDQTLESSIIFSLSKYNARTQKIYSTFNQNEDSNFITITNLQANSTFKIDSSPFYKTNGYLHRAILIENSVNIANYGSANTNKVLSENPSPNLGIGMESLVNINRFHYNGVDFGIALYKKGPVSYSLILFSTDGNTKQFLKDIDLGANVY